MTYDSKPPSTEAALIMFEKGSTASSEKTMEAASNHPGETPTTNTHSHSADDPEKAPRELDEGAPKVPNTSLDVAAKFGQKQLIVMCFVMALAIFLISIDETVIVTAIPKITDEFSTIADVGWYGSAYLLSICCFQLHFGKMYKDYPAKWVFLTSIGLFELGSLLCGVSPSSNVLILGRAIAGGGACGIISGVLIIIARSVPLRERPLYTAGVSSIRVVAGVGGPLLGGALTDSRLTWRW